MGAAKRTFLCECTGSAFISPDTAKIEFYWPGPAPGAGQFFLIKPHRSSVFLARPISAAGWDTGAGGTSRSDAAGRNSADSNHAANRSGGADNNDAVGLGGADSDNAAGWKGDTYKNGAAGLGGAGTVCFLVAARGRGSRELTEMRPGEEAELTGPLGNTWAAAAGLSDKASFDSPAAGTLALVTGGIGLAPLLAFMAELGERPFDLYAGFRTGSFGLENIRPGKLIVSTEDGSEGRKGRITDFFSPAPYAAVFACGPEPMLRVVKNLCMAAGVPCFISMEKHMACGTGACLGCRVKTLSGNRSCCSDGPVFNARELSFD